MGVSFGDLQGQVPFLTQSSNSKLRTMSEPVPLLRCAPDPLAGRAQRWKELNMDISSPCDTTKPDFKQNGHCEGSQNSDMAPGTSPDVEVSDLGSRAAEYLKHCGAISPQQEEGSTIEVPSALDRSSCNHLPASVNASEDLLRIVKHKQSAIVFCDRDCSSDNQVIFANESSDTGASSSSTTEEGDDDEDDFPETLQYKEFLVSRRCRNLSRNRKGLRKRQDAHPKSTASGWRKPTGKDKPRTFTGIQEEQDTRLNNGKQVRQTRQEKSDNKHREFLFTVNSQRKPLSRCMLVLYCTAVRHRHFSCHSRESTGVTNNVNNESVVFTCCKCQKVTSVHFEVREVPHYISEANIALFNSTTFI